MGATFSGAAGARFAWTRNRVKVVDRKSHEDDTAFFISVSRLWKVQETPETTQH
jgi:hypothetical protein